MNTRNVSAESLPTPYHAAYREHDEQYPTRAWFDCERSARLWLMDKVRNGSGQIDASLSAFDPHSGRMRVLYRETDAARSIVRNDLHLLAVAVDTEPQFTGSVMADAAALKQLCLDYAWARAFAVDPSCGFAFEAWVRTGQLRVAIAEFGNHAAISRHIDVLDHLTTIDDRIGRMRDGSGSGDPRDTAAAAERVLNVLKCEGYFAVLNPIAEVDDSATSGEGQATDRARGHDDIDLAFRYRRQLSELLDTGVSVIVPTRDGQLVEVAGGQNGWRAAAVARDPVTGERIYLGDLAAAERLSGLTDALESGPALTKLGVEVDTYPPIQLSSDAIGTLSDYESSVDLTRALVRVTATRQKWISDSAEQPLALDADQREAIEALDQAAAELRSYGPRGPALDPIAEYLVEQMAAKFTAALELGIGPVDIAHATPAFSEDGPFRLDIRHSNAGFTDHQPLDTALLHGLTTKYAWRLIELAETGSFEVIEEFDAELNAIREQILSMLTAPNLVGEDAWVAQQIAKVVPRGDLARAHWERMLTELGTEVPPVDDVGEQLALAAVELTIHASRQGLHAHDYPDERADIDALTDRYRALRAEAATEGLEAAAIESIVRCAYWTATVEINSEEPDFAPPGHAVAFAQAVAPDLPELLQVPLTARFADKQSAHAWLMTLAEQHNGPYEARLRTVSRLGDGDLQEIIDGRTPDHYIRYLNQPAENRGALKFLPSVISLETAVLAPAVADYVEVVESAIDRAEGSVLRVGDPDLAETEDTLLALRTELARVLGDASGIRNEISIRVDRLMNESSWAQTHFDEFAKVIGEIDLTAEQAERLAEVEAVCHAAASTVTRRSLAEAPRRIQQRYWQAEQAALAAGVRPHHIEAIKRRGFAEPVPDSVVLDVENAAAELALLCNRPWDMEFADTRQPERIVTIGWAAGGWAAFDGIRDDEGYQIVGTTTRYRRAGDLMGDLSRGVLSEEASGIRRWPPVPVPNRIRDHLNYFDERIARLARLAPDVLPTDGRRAETCETSTDPAEVAQARFEAARNAGERVRFTDPADSDRVLEVVLHHGEWAVYEYRRNATVPGGERRVGSVAEGHAARVAELLSDLEIGAPYSAEFGRSGEHLDPIEVPEYARARLGAIQDELDTLSRAARDAAATPDRDGALPYRARIAELDERGDVTVERVEAFLCDRDARKWLRDNIDETSTVIICAEVNRANPIGNADLPLSDIKGSGQEVAQRLDLLNEALDVRMGENHSLTALFTDYESTAVRLADDRLAGLRLYLLIHLDDLRQQIREAVDTSRFGAAADEQRKRTFQIESDLAVTDWEQLSSARTHRERNQALTAIYDTAREFARLEAPGLLEHLRDLEDTARVLGVSENVIETAANRGIDAGRTAARGSLRQPESASSVADGLTYNSDLFESDGDGAVKPIADRLRAEATLAVVPSAVLEHEYWTALLDIFTVHFYDPQEPQILVTVGRDYGKWAVTQRGRVSETGLRVSEELHFDRAVSDVRDVCEHLTAPTAHGHDCRAVEIPDWVRSELSEYQAQLDHLKALQAATVDRDFTMSHADLTSRPAGQVLPVLAPILGICEQYVDDPEEIVIREDGGRHGSQHVLAVAEQRDREAIVRSLRWHGYESPDILPPAIYVTGWNSAQLDARHDALIRGAESLERQHFQFAEETVERYIRTRSRGFVEATAAESAVHQAHAARERRNVDYRWWYGDLRRSRVDLDIATTGADPRVRELLMAIDDTQHGLDALSARAAFTQTGMTAIETYRELAANRSAAVDAVRVAAKQAAHETYCRAISSEPAVRPAVHGGAAESGRSPNPEVGRSGPLPASAEATGPPNSLIQMTEPSGGVSLRADWIATSNEASKDADPGCDTGPSL
ncbi:hypothetical protein [Nocardia arthritidis]|uniref:Uncharacterized protein n=1 Tax=Nocardia arthritidis TaxID=228602 RepID=A0A6G9YLN2_9NOCA|nr:hypothetical protein [Nocardia arthritidis]QIS13936.1 hypothetical protein F5544_30465 [Nocardia arthritidis]